MQVINTIEEMRAWSLDAGREGACIGFVPTMGCLHEGHLSLIRISRAEADLTVVSIFVNPSQFGPGEDYDKYPRTLERDLDLCRGEGVDVVFAPGDKEIYPGSESVYVDEKNISLLLCGKDRPGHFRGVLTIVNKLFNIIRPDLAVFGQKDFQQAALIRKMVRDLDIPVDILLGPIVREDDGLALSSRNSYLSPEERGRAVSLNRALLEAERMHAAGQTDPAGIRSAVESIITCSLQDTDTIDYISIVDSVTFRRATAQTQNPVLIAVAVRIGGTRLIDNSVLG